MDSFILSLQFLTRLPINKNVDIKDDSFAKSVLYFPIAGLIVGSLSALVYWLVSLFIGGLFPIVCAILANVCITGALHLDGLADTCDGVFSARKRDRMLEIMKDSRIGTNGALAIAFDLLFRLSLLASIKESAVILTLILAPVASKTIVPYLMKTSVYARAEGGMGKLFMEQLTWSRTIGAMLLGLLIHVAFSPITALLLVLIFVVGWLFKVYIYSKLQGMTGDTLGAASEIMEICFFILMASLGGV